MKYLFSTIIFGALMSIILVPANAQEWIQEGFDTYTVPKESITVDGDFTDWEYFEKLENVEFLTANGDWVSFEEYNGGKWNGEDDHSTTIAFAWDEDNFYVGIYVIDDEHQNSNSWFDGDATQMAFTDEDRTTIKYLYNFALSDGQDAILIGNEKAAGGGLTEDDIAIVRDDGTGETIYEAKYPAKILGFNTYKAGIEMGVGVCVNDGDIDTPGQKGWSGWGPHSVVFGKNAEKTGLVIFSAEGPPKAVNAHDKLATTWGKIKK